MLAVELLFNTVTVALFAAALITFVAVVREVFQHLGEEDRATLRAWHRFSSVLGINRAIGHAWEEHVRLFPRSRKRVLFASLLTVDCLSVLGYTFWLAALGQQR